jgi:hypothetical protein
VDNPGHNLTGNSSPHSIQRWNEILASLHDAAELIGVRDDVLKILERPQRVLEAAIPLRRDNGEVEVYTGWRVITTPRADLPRVEFDSIKMSTH